MPLKIAAPRIEVYALTKTDEAYAVEGPPSTVTIVQARESAHILRQSFFAKLEQRWSQGGEVTVVQHLGLEELSRLETRLTMIECNLEDEHGNRIFKSKTGPNGVQLDMTTEEFERAWGSLPLDVADEIHAKVLEMNPMWAGPGGEAS